MPREPRMKIENLYDQDEPAPSMLVPILILVIVILTCWNLFL